MASRNQQLSFRETSFLPYTNCNTRIIDLKQFDLLEHSSENEYRTRYLEIIKSSTPNSQLLQSAVQSLVTGIAPPVAFPTETVYGLGADATNAPAISGIFAAKGRPSDNPLIVHVASREHLERLTGEAIPEIYHDLVREHWPGPLTILVPVPKNSPFAKNVHPGQNTIGFRVPLSRYARFLISAADRPIAGPSANSSGKPSPTTAQHVKEDMSGKINFILDGGSCDVGVESTVVDGLHDPPLILRPGGLSRQSLIEHGKSFGNAWQHVAIGYKQHEGSIPTSGRDTPSGEWHLNGNLEYDAPRAPGMKYKHYAPQGRLILVEKTDSRPEALIREFFQATSPKLNGSSSVEEISQIIPKVAILATTYWSTTEGFEYDELANGSANLNSLQVRTTKLQIHGHGELQVYVIALGQISSDVARNLFSALRTCDVLSCNYIFAEAPQRIEKDGNEGRDWEAVMERMRKAASEIVSM